MVVLRHGERAQAGANGLRSSSLRGLNRFAVTGGLLHLRLGGTIAPPSIAIPGLPNVAAALGVQCYYQPNRSSAAYRLRGRDRQTFQNISRASRSIPNRTIVPPNLPGLVHRAVSSISRHSAPPAPQPLCAAKLMRPLTVTAPPTTESPYLSITSRNSHPSAAKPAAIMYAEGSGAAQPLDKHEHHARRTQKRYSPSKPIFRPKPFSSIQ